MKPSSPALPLVLVAALALSACGTRRPAVNEPEQPEPRANAHNAVIVPAIYFGMPRSTCSMVGVVTYGLGGDIAKWLNKPIDGAKLGEW